ncbi:MAG: hypothetical protein IJ187_11035 [Neisseriaceae bacterium]|nr:hypothetical protein [Neisseriaceae bacterium]MBQ9725719.1 hypothetical protein [Neisseriaceae bacterium]
MSDKTYIRALLVIVILGSIFTLSLLAYTFYLQQHCSIISYIGNVE